MSYFPLLRFGSTLVPGLDLSSVDANTSFCHGVWLCFLLLGGCTGIPEGVEPVRGFDLDRYLGTWYEAARLDHRFERGLSNVTANYSLREDGGVAVLNRGYNAGEERWEEAAGKAYFQEGPEVGRLKVSFFGPFYGGYNVLALDQEDYSWSIVAGPNRSYLWLLTRSPSPPQALLDRLVARATELGFPTDELIFVKHNDLSTSEAEPDAALRWVH